MDEQEQDQYPQDPQATDEPLLGTSLLEQTSNENDDYVRDAPSAGPPIPDEVFPARLTDMDTTPETGVNATSEENEGAGDGPPANPNPGDTTPPAAAGTTTSPAGTVDGTLDVDRASKEDLEAEVQRRGLTVTGTGANGNVLVEDLRNALREDDAKRAAAPSA